MKKKNLNSKLSLKKETLNILNAELNIRGGDAGGSGAICEPETNNSCRNSCSGCPPTGSDVISMIMPSACQSVIGKKCNGTLNLIG